MSPVMKLAAILCVTICGVACSSSPPQVEKPQAATPAAAATSAPAATNGTAPQIDPKLIAQGYRAVKHKGQYVYCRSEAVTGTQFQKKVCLTEDAIRDLERKTQETVDSMSKPRTGPACFPGVNC